MITEKTILEEIRSLKNQIKNLKTRINKLELIIEEKNKDDRVLYFKD